MLYISKGILITEKDGRCCVFRRGTEFHLTRTETEIWKAGRDRLCESDAFLTLEDMEDEGLISIAENNSEKSIYDLLCDCMFIPQQHPNDNNPLTATESILYVWLRDAGIRLTTAELICLCEQDIAPAQNLLGESNRQVLVSAIYLNNDVNDFTLEDLMISAKCKDWVIAGLLSLVQKQYLYIG